MEEHQKVSEPVMSDGLAWRKSDILPDSYEAGLIIAGEFHRFFLASFDSQGRLAQGRCITVSGSQAGTKILTTSDAVPAQQSGHLQMAS